MNDASYMSEAPDQGGPERLQAHRMGCRLFAARQEGKNMQLHSDDVRLQVLNALHWDLAVPRHRVKVEVENGWVTMSGLVDLPYQRSCAEFDARNIPGVVGVINRIRLASNDAD